MMELVLYNARKHFGENSVLNDAGFILYEGDKAGITGANGSGKTTILKLLAGIEPMDIDYRKISEGKSRITIPRDSVIGYLEQSPDYPGKMKVGEILALAFKFLECQCK
ncbi:MAG: ATP-binding cassette domain-containing protein, partial [Clostridiales bacterium]|nr:ATP-binding cassette domain-containing protein [Clostridiales bacterium]